MVAPFKPYSKYVNTGRFILSASGTKQVPPFVNTAYTCKTYESVKGFMSPNASNSTWDATITAATVAATNAARQRLVNQLGDTSSLGATLTAERKETYGMIKSAVVNLLLSANAVRRGRLDRAAHILGIAAPEVLVVSKKALGPKRKDGTRRVVKTRKKVLVLPSGRQVAHKASGWWLWWSYGVSPLMGDIYNSVDVLQREQPWMRIEGRGNGSSVWSQSYPSGVVNSAKSNCKVSMSVNVRVKNPNLFLANQLGLTNPIQWLNEGIPFSFVIDWFSNLSQVISQMTDFVGLETADPVTATKNVRIVTQSTVYGYETLIRKDFARTLSIPSAKLRFAYETFQWQRGANAIALLVGFLKKQ